MSFKKISHSNPARITLFADARSTRPERTREFESISELADFFGRRPEVREEKEDLPLFSRGRCEGRRKKRSLRPPFLVMLDVDKSKISMVDCSRRLDMLGVGHVAYETWSHGVEQGTHSYRVLTGVLAGSWEEVEAATGELFRLAGVEPTRESATCPAFFVPGAAAGQTRGSVAVLEGDWLPSEISALVVRERKSRIPAPADSDDALLREALAAVDNEPREDWIRIGMALHSTGRPDAREIWDEWSQGQGYADFDIEKSDAAWESFSDTRVGGVGIGTIFRMARLAGWRPSRASAADDFRDVMDPRLRTLRALNERYAYVAVGQGMVADLGEPSGRIDFKTIKAFLHLHAHPVIASGRVRRDGMPIDEPAGKVWLERWPERRSFSRADFLPPGGPEGLPADTLNLWRGWGEQPAPGCCDRYLDHVRQIICSGDEKLYRWVVAWMAHLVQRPWEKAGTAIVLRSGEGTGKGIFASALVELCGSHGLHVTQPNQLTGNFNSHLVSKLLVFADEVTWGGRKQEEGVLKAMITERTVMVEPKGVDAFAARSFLRVIVSSNNDWVVPAGRTARRFQVLDVSEARLGDPAYFQAILQELRAGGRAALMHWLSGLDLADWPSPRAVVSTPGLLDQKIQSMEPTERWLLDVARAGRLDDRADGWPDGWVSTSELYDSYLEHARQAGITRKAAEMTVSTKLKTILGEGYRKTQRPDAAGRRVMHCWLPTLAETRRRIGVWLRADIDWEA